MLLIFFLLGFFVFESIYFKAAFWTIMLSVFPPCFMFVSSHLTSFNLFTCQPLLCVSSHLTALCLLIRLSMSYVLWLSLYKVHPSIHLSVLPPTWVSSSLICWKWNGQLVMALGLYFCQVLSWHSQTIPRTTSQRSIGLDAMHHSTYTHAHLNSTWNHDHAAS